MFGVHVLLLGLDAAVVAVTTTEEAETKAPVVVEKKGKARDKELVGSIPKVCLVAFGLDICRMSRRVLSLLRVLPRL